MAGLQVKVEGDIELIKELKRLGVDVDRVLETALEAGAEVVQRAANPKAPAPHIEIGDVEKRGDRTQVKVGPDDEHWYYRYFETGASAHQIAAVSGATLRLAAADGDGYGFPTAVPHPGMGAKPFLRPALDENEAKASNAMGDELKGAILKGKGG
jgi:HK97 gp10 family phage protein